MGRAESRHGCANRGRGSFRRANGVAAGTSRRADHKSHRSRRAPAFHRGTFSRQFRLPPYRALWSRARCAGQRAGGGVCRLLPGRTPRSAGLQLVRAGAEAPRRAAGRHRRYDAVIRHAAHRQDRRARDAARSRDAGVRSPGRRHEGLHVRRDDGLRDAGGSRGGYPVRRARPAQPDQRRAYGRPDPRVSASQLVHRALPGAAASRDDDRRARPVVQRALPRAPRRTHRGADARLEAHRLARPHRTSVGDAVAEHADARHRDRLSRSGPARGDKPLGGSRHHAAV